MGGEEGGGKRGMYIIAGVYIFSNVKISCGFCE